MQSSEKLAVPTQRQPGASAKRWRFPRTTKTCRVLCTFCPLLPADEPCWDQHRCLLIWGWLPHSDEMTQHLLIKSVTCTYFKLSFHKTFLNLFYPFLLTTTTWVALPKAVRLALVRGKAFYTDGKYLLWEQKPSYRLTDRVEKAVIWISLRCALNGVTASSPWAGLSINNLESRSSRPSLCTNDNPAPVHIDLSHRDSKICSYPTTPSLPESLHVHLLPFSALFHSNVHLYLTCAGTGHLKGLSHAATILNRCSLLYVFYKQTAAWLEQAKSVGVFKWCNRLLSYFHSSSQNLNTAQLEPRET